MTEHLSEREGVPRTEHPYGVPYGAAYRNKKYHCRCEWCKKSNANRYQTSRGREAPYSIPRAPGEKPPRPPGVIWLDWSGVTAVVRCERCQKNYGVWLDQASAIEFQTMHTQLHYKDAPFDWDAFDKARLIKNPGGRPPRESTPLCASEDCMEDARTLGLCGTHYKAHQRSVARSEAAQVAARIEFAEKVKRTSPPAPRTKALCKAPMCGSRPIKGTYCEAHT